MGLRVLIAEDDSLVLMGLSLMAERIGHEVVATASDGEEACQKALAFQPDLLLMDIHMPNLNGIDALRLIKMQMNIACILVTAYSDEAFLEAATNLGVIGYVVKPVSEWQLKASIDVGIRRYKETLKARDEAHYYKNALEERKMVERAKGILMDRLGLREAEAMKNMQKRSRDANVKLIAIAEEIIKADNCLR